MVNDFDDALFLPKLNNPSEYNTNFFEKSLNKVLSKSSSLSEAEKK